ncbi:hypothetical protein PV783_14055 [Chitinophaga sp. CC14]|uniref:hypothetical protein n=1 Tax=Chitinophaga sp. CC14 TaxID=3029199 RepID=UPI003B79D59E
MQQKIPGPLEVMAYFFRMGLEHKHADAFLLYYGKHNWQIANGKKVKNWKILAYNWVRSFSKSKPVRNIPMRPCFKGR